jgi:hypothetical protein
MTISNPLSQLAHRRINNRQDLLTGDELNELQRVKELYLVLEKQYLEDLSQLLFPGRRDSGKEEVGFAQEFQCH